MITNNYHQLIYSSTDLYTGEGSGARSSEPTAMVWCIKDDGKPTQDRKKSSKDPAMTSPYLSTKDFVISTVLVNISTLYVGTVADPDSQIDKSQKPQAACTPQH